MTDSIRKSMQYEAEYCEGELIWHPWMDPKFWHIYNEPDMTLFINIFSCEELHRFCSNLIHTLKTGIPVKERDCILKLLRRVSRPEIQLGVAFHSELLTFSLRKQSTSSFILNFLECISVCTYTWVSSYMSMYLTSVASGPSYISIWVLGEVKAFRNIYSRIHYSLPDWFYSRKHAVLGPYWLLPRGKCIRIRESKMKCIRIHGHKRILSK